MSQYNGIALIIGISNYCSQIGNLENALTDSQKMCNHFVRCRYQVESLENPSANDINAKLRFIQMKMITCSYRNVIIYYSGRGLFNMDAHYMLLSEFMNSDNVKVEDQLYINAYKVESLIDSICSVHPDENGQRAVVVILDTSRSSVESLRPERSGKSNEVNLSMPQQKTFDFCYIARTGFLISYACGRGEKSRNDGRNGGSIYSEQIIEKIFRPGVSIIDSLGAANQMVCHVTNGWQKPQMETNFPHMFKFSLFEEEAEPSIISTSQNIADREEDNFTALLVGL